MKKTGKNKNGKITITLTKSWLLFTNTTTSNNTQSPTSGRELATAASPISQVCNYY